MVNPLLLITIVAIQMENQREFGVIQRIQKNDGSTAHRFQVIRFEFRSFLNVCLDCDEVTEVTTQTTTKATTTSTKPTEDCTSIKLEGTVAEEFSVACTYVKTNERYNNYPVFECDTEARRVLFLRQDGNLAFFGQPHEGPGPGIWIKRVSDTECPLDNTEDFQFWNTGTLSIDQAKQGSDQIRWGPSDLTTSTTTESTSKATTPTTSVVTSQTTTTKATSTSTKPATTTKMTTTTSKTTTPTTTTTSTQETITTTKAMTKATSKSTTKPTTQATTTKASSKPGELRSRNSLSLTVSSPGEDYFPKINVY